MPGTEAKMEAERRYISGEMSLKALAADMGLNKKTVEGWSSACGWQKKRADIRRRAMSRAANQAVKKKAHEMCRLLEASEEMETALLMAAQIFVKKMSEDNGADMLADGKIRADNLNRIVHALSQQAETRKLLRGMLDDPENPGKDGVSIRMDKETEEMAE